ncbi:uncharacterized protein FOKN1_0643 [Thiohalobacter thiocyanaticus]|uniref:DUF748 domain-containing protein n=1 Tax=Thiohalobacter thiocyanaticus TaxID=585455 RepID=A0A1Z4VNG7_9GAMM|nr:DUF748 domain-containing protein [Thiohalobacter thiocyanaticus]BAZ93045.1 uncharacterized protein FOKN1_0643 [Thiohalobacter thiocyanaticus]
MTPRGRKLSLTLTILALVFLLALVMLPYGIKWVLQDQLRERGAAAATISDVNFNPFKGTLVIRDLDVRAPDGGRLRAQYAFVDIDWLDLFERHVNIRKLQLNSADVTLRLEEDGKWYLAGLSEPVVDPDRPAEPEPDAEAPTWTVQLQSLSLQSTRLGYAMPRWEAGLVIEALEILELNTRNVDQAAHIDFSGELNDAPVKITAELSPFAETPEYRLNTRVQALGLSQFQAFLPEGWRLAAGQFMVDGDWRIRQPEAAAWAIDYSGRLALAEADLAHPEMKLSSQALEWDGSLGLSLPAGEAAPSLTLEGELSNTGLDLQANAPGLSVQREQMSFTGTVGIADLSDPTGLTLAGSIDNRGLQVRQREPARGLLEADRLQVQDLAIAGLDDIRVVKVAADGLRMLAPLEAAEAGEAVFASPGVAIRDIRFEARQRLKVNEVALGKAQIQLVRKADGGWRGLSVPAGTEATQGSPAAPAGAEGEAAEASEPVRVSIGAVTLAGGSTFTFTDRSVEPAYVNEVNLERFRLEQIDTGAPETPLQLALEAKSEKYSGLTANGWIKPFGEQLSSAIELGIEHLSLPPLSPYMAMTTGYSIRSGSVSVDSRIDIDAGQMNITNDLRLDQFHVQPVSEEQRQRIDQKLSMPLGTALSTLRDDNDNIALRLPVTGSVEDPSFGISDAINQALAKALKTAAVSYIKFALQPYGSLIAVGQFVGEKMSHIRLEPVAFANGSAALDQDAGQYLQKIGELLQKRPELQLRVCGYAVPADRAALHEQRQAEAGKAEAAPGGDGRDAAPAEPGAEIEPIADQTLLDLAGQRARAVQDSLVQTHGVDPGRLFVCQPELESDPDAKAGVALNL